jgi:hypothetical protein
MPDAGPAVSRRTLLLGAVVGAAAVACRGESRVGNGPQTTTAPDQATVEAAVTAERRLLAGYDAALAAGGGGAALRQARAVHAAHLSALLDRRSPSAAPSASPTGVVDGPTGRDLLATERASVADLQAAASAVVDGATAGVLASVAASHAAHTSAAAP